MQDFLFRRITTITSTMEMEVVDIDRWGRIRTYRGTAAWRKVWEDQVAVYPIREREARERLIRTMIAEGQTLDAIAAALQTSRRSLYRRYDMPRLRTEATGGHAPATNTT